MTSALQPSRPSHTVESPRRRLVDISHLFSQSVLAQTWASIVSITCAAARSSAVKKYANFFRIRSYEKSSCKSFRFRSYKKHRGYTPPRSVPLLCLSSSFLLQSPPQGGFF